MIRNSLYFPDIQPKISVQPVHCSSLPAHLLKHRDNLLLCLQDFLLEEYLSFLDDTGLKGLPPKRLCQTWVAPEQLGQSDQRSCCLGLSWRWPHRGKGGRGPGMMGACHTLLPLPTSPCPTRFSLSLQSPSSAALQRGGQGRGLQALPQVTFTPRVTLGCSTLRAAEEMPQKHGVAHSQVPWHGLSSPWSVLAGGHWAPAHSSHCRVSACPGNTLVMPLDFGACRAKCCHSRRGARGGEGRRQLAGVPRRRSLGEARAELALVCPRQSLLSAMAAAADVKGAGTGSPTMGLSQVAPRGKRSALPLLCTYFSFFLGRGILWALPDMPPELF